MFQPPDFRQLGYHDSNLFLSSSSCLSCSTAGPCPHSFSRCLVLYYVAATWFMQHPPLGGYLEGFQSFAMTSNATWNIWLWVARGQSRCGAH